ncbi:MAG: electron transfer flavoprotein subunit beta/FixA family protein [Candidatus Eremiobacteraeota bacterium]|nr:electron transfer flavoprotein subunit beta/FixA family protein [Candidatus Eremiobacteraeota bacterium]
MKIVVTVKVVPDPNSTKRIDPNTKRLVRSGADNVINPYDEYALEAALQLKEKLGADTTVSVVSMVPESSKEVVRKALAMGADDAVMLSDAAFEASDVWDTARVLAEAIRKHGFDLVICGGLSDDSSTGAVPGALAEHLGVPGLTNAKRIDVSDGKLKIQRETDSGYQVVSGPLPAVVSVTMGVGEPRYPSLKGIMGAKKKTISMESHAELGVSDALGTNGAKTELLDVAAPPARAKGQVVTAADGAEGAKIIFDFLQEKKLV